MRQLTSKSQRGWRPMAEDCEKCKISFHVNLITKFLRPDSMKGIKEFTLLKMYAVPRRKMFIFISSGREYLRIHNWILKSDRGGGRNFTRRKMDANLWKSISPELELPSQLQMGRDDHWAVIDSDKFKCETCGKAFEARVDSNRST